MREPRGDAVQAFQGVPGGGFADRHVGVVGPAGLALRRSGDAHREPRLHQRPEDGELLFEERESLVVAARRSRAPRRGDRPGRGGRRPRPPPARPRSAPGACRRNRSRSPPRGPRPASPPRARSSRSRRRGSRSAAGRPDGAGPRPRTPGAPGARGRGARSRRSRPRGRGSIRPGPGPTAARAPPRHGRSPTSPALRRPEEATDARQQLEAARASLGQRRPRHEREQPDEPVALGEGAAETSPPVSASTTRGSARSGAVRAR